MAVIGTSSVDRVDGGPARLGGAPLYAAQALRLLGTPARLVTRLRRADAEAFLPQLARHGLPVSWRAGETAEFSFAYRDRVREMTVEACGEPWSAEEARGWIAEALGGVRLLHVGALLRSDFPPDTLAELARGRRLLLDGQGLVRPATVGPLVLDSEFDRQALRHVSILKLAEEEAFALGADSEGEGLSELGVREVIVTLGPRGSLVLRDGAVCRVPAHPIESVDPTGAGDAFAAAYLVSRGIGQSPGTAARRATAVVAALLMARRR